MALNINVIIIMSAFLLAIVAIALLYVIIMPKSTSLEDDKNFQLTTKNILEHVKTLQDKGEYALVQLLALKYLDRLPSHTEVRKYLARAYHAEKKYNNAIKQCLIILKKVPGDVETRKLLADCFAKKGFAAKAMKEYEILYETNSRDETVLTELGILYQESEQYRYAIEIYKILTDVIKQKDELAKIYSTLAELNETVRDYPAAFEAYKYLLEIYPTDITANQKLVNLYILIKNHAKAIETLHFMLGFVTEPKVLIWIHEKLIALYEESDDYSNAIKYSNQLLDIQGVDKYPIRKNIALLNIKMGNYDDGIVILEELVMMTQHVYDVTTELANVYILQKQFDKALENYTILLDKSTQKEAKAVRNLICDLFIEWAIEDAENNDYQSAKKHLELAEEYNAVNSEIYYNKAINEFTLKNYANSVNLLNQALTYDKFNNFHSKYLLKLAEVHHEMNHFFEEKKALSDLLKIDENNSNGLYRTGLMYASQHDMKHAEEYFNKALAIDPHMLAAKYNLALLLETNNSEKSKELYREILEEDSSFIEAKNALADLQTSGY